MSKLHGQSKLLLVGCQNFVGISIIHLGTMEFAIKAVVIIIPIVLEIKTIMEKDKILTSILNRK